MTPHYDSLCPLCDKRWSRNPGSRWIDIMRCDVCLARRGEVSSIIACKTDYVPVKRGRGGYRGGGHVSPFFRQLIGKNE